MIASGVSRKQIFIYAPNDKKYENIYAFLRSADFRTAHDRNQSGMFRIGLETVLSVLDQKLQDNKPDVIYLETSLFPERTRINDKIVDFLCLKFNEELSPAERDALLSEVFKQYKLIYNALHKTENTVYYVPEFMKRPTQMQMVFSTFEPAAAPAAIDPQMQTELMEIDKEIANIKQSRMMRDDLESRKKQQHNGWIASDDRTYVTRDFLERNPSDTDREGKANPRKEEKSELETNAFIFHKLFHERAFEPYKKSFLMCIPIIGAGEKESTRRKRQLNVQESTPHLVGQGALFVLLGYRRNDIELDPEILARDIAVTVSYVLKDYFISYLYTSSREMVDEVINRSLSAAAGAIMSRNISHNIGSHVAPRTRITAIEERLEWLYKFGNQAQRESGAEE